MYYLKLLLLLFPESIQIYLKFQSYSIKFIFIRTVKEQHIFFIFNEIKHYLIYYIYYIICCFSLQVPTHTYRKDKVVKCRSTWWL